MKIAPWKSEQQHDRLNEIQSAINMVWVGLSSHLMSIEDRALGVILGQLIGDSLGSLVEFQTADGISARYPDGVQELADGGPFNLSAGQPTDDSEMALALARSLSRHGGYDSDDALESYARWARSEPFDIGNTTIQALVYGFPNPESQANGALMRVSPLAIAYAGRAEEAAVAARADATLTHPHSLCGEINAAFIGVLAEVVAGEWDAKQALAAFLASSDEGVREIAGAAVAGPPADFQHQMGWVKTAFQNALYELAVGTSFEESLVRTVGRGGDTDTKAAIAGALLGGVYGLSGIPERWVDGVLSCRPAKQSLRPRPEEYWPTDARELTLDLLKIAG